MTKSQPPVAVRLIGFPEQEASILEATLPVEQSRRYRYFRLPEHSLQDADLFLANADQLAALTTLSALGPSELRPALLIGAPPLALPHPCIPRPIRWNRLFEELNLLMEKRRQLWAQLDAAQRIAVPERRRRPRVDFDLTDPAEYLRMRAPAAPEGGVLLVGGAPPLQEMLARFLQPYSIAVEHVDSAAAALEACTRQRPTLVLIDVLAPEANPYHLCAAIKKRAGATRITVIFLTGKGFRYDRIEASAAGCDGTVALPLPPQHWLPLLNKLLPLAH